MSSDGSRSLGPYELLELIGSGGMGEVYRARDPRLRREVAVKILKATDRVAVDRFKNEARAVAAITHPNIMAVHDYGEADGVAYIVYELLEGQSLRRRILRGALPWRTAVEIASDIATGLAAAHAKGIVHGDVKPENVFVTSEGRVALVDFGLARLATAVAAGEATAPLDEAHGIAGTLAYMAPETLTGETPTPASDLFALGCVLYEMITGHPAFLAASAGATLDNILNGEPVAISELARNVPHEIEAIVERCLSKQPSNRFGSARDLSLTLRTLLSTSTRSRSVPVEKSARYSRRKWIAASILLLTGVSFGVWSWRESARSAGPRIDIAVLPFENSTGDAGSDYVADGLTENLINALSQVPALSVRARASVFRLKGRSVTPEQAAKDLRADVLVLGRVRKRGQTMLISAELMNPAEKRQLWGRVYERRSDQLLGIQEEIAREVAAALQVPVSGSVSERIAARMPSNNQAYELYLLGRYQLNKRTEESFVHALSFFTRALERDPSFALAYSGLADCYVLLNGYGLRKPAEVVPKAKAAARRALELDPALAEAHTTLAALYANHDYDWRAAEEEYRKAIELNPSYATARQWYGGLLTGLGRFDDAMTQLDMARQLDPLSVVIPVQIGLRFYFDRRPDDALRWYRVAMERAPDLATAHEYTALAYEAKGMFREAVDAELRSERAKGTAEADIASARRAFQSDGFTGFKKWQLQRLLEQSRTEYVSPVELAMLYAKTGQHDLAIAQLTIAVEERSSGTIWLALEPRLDPLRGDPRFERLLQRINLKS